MTRVVCALLVSLCCSTAVRAQQDEVGASYQYWITQALEAFHQGQLERARTAFERAHAIDPSARTLRGLGAVDFQAGRFADAFVELSAALADRQKPLSPELQSAVRALVLRVRANVGLCELVDAPDAVHITVDGVPATVDIDGHIVLSAGHHRLRLEAPGSEPTSMDIDPTIGGAIERLHVQFAPARSTPQASPPAPTTPLTAPTPEVRYAVPPPALMATHSRTWTWVAASGVPLFVIGAGLSWQRAQDLGDGIAQRCKRERCTSERREALIDESPLSTYETLTNVAWALAGGCLVAAGVAFALEGASVEKTSPRLTLGPGTVTLRASF